jgi:hypothetical protein
MVGSAVGAASCCPFQMPGRNGRKVTQRSAEFVLISLRYAFYHFTLLVKLVSGFSIIADVPFCQFVLHPAQQKIVLGIK